MLIYGLFVWPYRSVLNPLYRTRPLASNVLRAYIRWRGYPSWTSYFVKYRDVQDDDFGEKHYNLDVDGHNYHILRIGCFPFIKYHCTKRPYQDLSFENLLFKAIAVVNLGFPCLLYGLAALSLVRHTDHIIEPKTGKRVAIHFLVKELHN
uniref:Lipase maturation factor n=2 Tax=Ascaris TaxID=6251 RepID=A0A0M3HSN4_ASCLU